MPIKNDTTVVDVYQSLGEIQGALANHGAKRIMIEYDDVGQPVSVAFGIETPLGFFSFLLSANVDGVKTVFDRQKVKAIKGQAERTAWRNIRDWVMAQMALIESGQVEMDQVFLPYLADRTGKTLYQLYKAGQIALGDGKDD